MRNLSLLWISLSFAFNLAHAQIYEMDQTPISDCNGFFADPGGLSGDYPASAALETLICSSSTAPGQTHIRLDFTSLNLLVGDTIRFFDGINNNAPEIVLPVDMHNPLAFSVQASAGNSSGCLVVQFQSDAEGEASGWRSEIHCQQTCQRIDTDITTAQSPDEGNNTFYFCPGDTARFTADVLFPENGQLYNQSVANSMFQWRVTVN